MLLRLIIKQKEKSSHWYFLKKKKKFANDYFCQAGKKSFLFEMKYA